MSKQQDLAIKTFWAWWAKARPTFEAAIESGDYGDLIDDAAKHVHAIHQELNWEMGSGLRAEHFLALSPNGDAVLRKVSERWLASAPKADDTWEYWPARPPRPDATLTCAEHPMRLEEATFQWTLNEMREVLDVTLFHPAFAKMSQDDRESAGVLLLDGALGEDDVERWIGGIEPAKKAPMGAKPFPAFMKALEKLAASATGGVLVTLEGEDDDGHPMEVVYNAALKRIDHLDLDLHVELTLHLQRPDARGLASKVDAAKLEKLEDDLEERLEESAAWLGHVTANGQRVVHFFAAESSGAADILERWMKEHAQLRPALSSEKDEAWDAAFQWDAGDDDEAS